MYEIHGWLVVQDSAYESDELQLERIISNVRQRIESFRENNPMVELVALNGQYRLLFSALLNHEGPATRSILDLFEWVGEIASGSYGLLFVRNDEDPLNNNNFIVHVLRRGAMAALADPFLSPCNPAIED